MKIFNVIMSAVQGVLVAGYIVFYNIQFFWSIKSSIMSLVNVFVR